VRRPGDPSICRGQRGWEGGHQTRVLGGPWFVELAPKLAPYLSLGMSLWSTEVRMRQAPVPTLGTRSARHRTWWPLWLMKCFHHLTATLCTQWCYPYCCREEAEAPQNSVQKYQDLVLNECTCEALKARACNFFMWPHGDRHVHVEEH
jgi:hypothetical protein